MHTYDEYNNLLIQNGYFQAQVAWWFIHFLAVVLVVAVFYLLGWLAGKAWVHITSRLHPAMRRSYDPLAMRIDFRVDLVRYAARRGDFVDARKHAYEIVLAVDDEYGYKGGQA